ncbi:MAG TPA: hypothetical protein PK680_10415 [Novosphingobium sp.]|nr:hypothetical protein [Novosphingobium sp.]HQA18782.1 hypothetical protein [Novosphingobium sp.]
MRTLLTAAAASAICLAASPALAQAINDDDANALLAKLSTPAFDFCTDSDRAKERPPIDQYNACQTAKAELAEARKKDRKATPGQKEVYGFFGSALEMGTTYSMLRVDGSPTARVCQNIELQWVLASKSNPELVGPDLRDALSATKEAVRPLVKLCRDQFPTPAGALAI